jgi:endogenous inhibitor of DNA gyrase (YacG/DUF329 family)
MSEKTYTQQQKNQIVEDFWKTGGSNVLCPEDKTNARPLALTREKNNSPAGYFLRGECLTCGRAVNVSRQDDSKFPFREWTENEEKQMAENYLAGKSAKCPICDSNVKINPFGDAKKYLQLNCERCGNTGDLQIQPES